MRLTPSPTDDVVPDGDETPTIFRCGTASCTRISGGGGAAPPLKDLRDQF